MRASPEKLALFQQVLADVIKRRRQALNLSLTEMGIRSGLSQQSVSYLERRMRSPNVETLLRVADALNISLARLVGQVEREVETKRSPSRRGSPSPSSVKAGGKQP